MTPHSSVEGEACSGEEGATLPLGHLEKSWKGHTLFLLGGQKEAVPPKALLLL